MKSKNLPANTARTGAQINFDILISKVQQAFTAKQFTAWVSIKGIDANTGEEFHTDIMFNNTDPEFTAMLNDYGARLCGKKIEETFMPVTDRMPADGALVTVKASNGDEINCYRFLGEWFDINGFPLIISVRGVTQYKVFTPSNKTA